jgi:hypothetical protein
MNLKNFTPHAINFRGTVVPPSGQVARVKEVTTLTDVVGLVRKSFGEVEGLPTVIRCNECQNCEGGLDCANPPIVIVSSMVGQALVGQARINMFVSPADLVRNEAGQVIGCNSLQLWN